MTTSTIEAARQIQRQALQPEPDVFEYLSFDQSSGAFTWKVTRGRMAKAGDVAGGYNEDGYILINFKGRKYSAHKLAWFFTHGEWPASDMDHINGKRADNRPENLRLATKSQNCMNRRKYRSGLKGVHLRPSGRWSAYVRINGKQKALGCFDTEHEAHAAYVEASQRIYGEFARAD